MSKKRDRGTTPERGPRVWACRGGDCGSRVKHPDVDHRGQLGDLQRGLAVPVTVTRCLDACEHSNVIVVRDSEGEVLWLGEMNDADATRAVVEHARGGTAGAAQELEWRTFRPSRRMREQLPE